MIFLVAVKTFVSGGRVGAGLFLVSFSTLSFLTLGCSGRAVELRTFMAGSSYYHMYSVKRRCLPFQNNPKNLDPSNKKNIDTSYETF